MGDVVCFKVVCEAVGINHFSKKKTKKKKKGKKAAKWNVVTHHSANLDHQCLTSKVQIGSFFFKLKEVTSDKWGYGGYFLLIFLFTKNQDQYPISVLFLVPIFDLLFLFSFL